MSSVLHLSLFFIHFPQKRSAERSLSVATVREERKKERRKTKHFSPPKSKQNKTPFLNFHHKNRLVVCIPEALQIRLISWRRRQRAASTFNSLTPDSRTALDSEVRHDNSYLCRSGYEKKLPAALARGGVAQRESTPRLPEGGEEHAWRQR